MKRLSAEISLILMCLQRQPGLCGHETYEIQSESQCSNQFKIGHFTMYLMV